MFNLLGTYLACYLGKYLIKWNYLTAILNIKDIFFTFFSYHTLRGRGNEERNGILSSFGSKRTFKECAAAVVVVAAAVVITVGSGGSGGGSRGSICNGIISHSLETRENTKREGVTKNRQYFTLHKQKGNRLKVHSPPGHNLITHRSPTFIRPPIIKGKPRKRCVHRCKGRRRIR